jgi:hypothetical protein
MRADDPEARCRAARPSAKKRRLIASAKRAPPNEGDDDRPINTIAFQRG